MKWIITGGAGFIGSHAAERRLSKGDEVVAIDDLSRVGSERNLDRLRERGLSRFLRIDIRDGAALERAFAEHDDADAVLHLAGQVAVTWSVDNPRADFEANALGTFNVLEAVRRAMGGRPAVLYSSTNKVYGGLDLRACELAGGRWTIPSLPLGVDESEPLDFHSPYGCSKGAGDQYVRDYARIYGMRTVVLRQSCIYGTRQFGVEDQGWIAWFCIAALLGRSIRIYGDGRQVRDTLWIDDLLDLYELAIDRIDDVRGEAFNVGGGPSNCLSLLELLDRLRARFGIAIDPAFEPTRPGDQKVFVADIRKAESRLGWRPKVAPDEGVAKLAEWIDANRALFR